MIMYQIDKKVPMPKGRTTGYPFKEMKVGDSFVFDEANRAAVANSSNYYARKNRGVKFTVRKQSVGKCRIWRIA
jgi:hypothetical protein